MSLCMQTSPMTIWRYSSSTKRGRAIQQAVARKLDDFILHNALYALAFLGADSSAMAEQQKWFAGHPDAENFGLSLASDTEAFAGHLGKARELTKRSVESAIRADSKENGAIWHENAAVREAAISAMLRKRSRLPQTA